MSTNNNKQLHGQNNGQACKTNSFYQTQDAAILTYSNKNNKNIPLGCKDKLRG